MDYRITYQLPNNRWYTKSCEDGAAYVRKLLKRGIAYMNIQLWTSRGSIIEMYYNRDEDSTMTVAAATSYYYSKSDCGRTRAIHKYGFTKIHTRYGTIVKSC